MFDAVRRAFGAVDPGSRVTELSRLLLEYHLLSLITTWGFVMWAGSKMQWNLRCTAQYQQVQLVLDGYIAGWCMILRSWGTEKDMSRPRHDLHLIDQLQGWLLTIH